MRHIKKFIKFLLTALEPLLNLLFKIFPFLGTKKYNLMQKYIYKKMTSDIDLSEEVCVGHFDAHQKFPYEDYLLEFYPDNKEKLLALDFGCGPGRMVKRMMSHFEEVHGVDLVQNNLTFAEQNLKSSGFDEKRYKFFLTDGTGNDLSNIPHLYDFIFSTICLQHIPVYSIRMTILKQLYSLLKDGGQASLQMGYGWDNGVYWRDNNFNATTSNGGSDISIPDQSHFAFIEEDMASIGFEVISIEVKGNPHPYLIDYHTNHLFINLKK